MANITFRGAQVRYIDTRYKEGQAFNRLHVSTDYSDNVAREMEWPEELSSALDQGKLSGRLNVSNFILTPNEKTLRNFEINVKATEARDFAFHRSGGDESKGKPPETKVNFIIHVPDFDDGVKLSRYFYAVGQSEAALKMDCAHQGKLDLEASNEEAKEEAEQEPATQEDENVAGGPILQRPHGVPSRPGINRQRNRRGGDETVVTDDEGQPVLTGEAAEAHETLRRKAKHPGVN